MSINVYKFHFPSRILGFNGVDNEESRRMVSSGMLRRVALVRTDVSEELSASFIRAVFWLLGRVAIIRTDVSEEHSISSQRASVGSYF
jgi:hypothetical protein